VDATDVLSVDPAELVVTVVDVEGLRALRLLVGSLISRPKVRARSRNGK